MKTEIQRLYFVLAILGCSLASNAQAQYICSEEVGIYANTVTNKRGAVIDNCASADKVFSPIYREHSVGGGKRGSLNQNQYRSARDYYTSCFQSVSDIAIETDSEYSDLRNGLSKYLYTLVAQGNGKSVAFCSAVSLGIGFAAPAHCFEDGTHRRGLGNKFGLEYHSTSFQDDGSVKFVPNSFYDWNVYGVDGTNYKPLTASDFYYFLPPIPGAEIKIMQDIEPYVCGQAAYIAGVSSLYLKTLRYFGKHVSLNNGILVGGYRSWCLGMEQEGNIVVKHLCSSTGGQSGAPILVYNERGFRPIGMHLGGKMESLFDPKNESAENFMFIFEMLRNKTLSYIGKAGSL